MNDWRDKLADLNRDLQNKERAEDEKKAAVLNGFRKLLSELETVCRNVGDFGDAFGVDCDYEINRFGERYPVLRFRIKKPLLAYEVACKDGVLYEQLKEGTAAPKVSRTTMEALAPKRFEERVTAWVQAAANTNRKVPGKR
ncbi:MAG: hypothetical protein ACM3XM_09605 [Mycobacterium leprae]